jgi:hypothetical protein
LTSCIEFDEKEAEAILAESSPHRFDEDGGYREFIKAVNRVLGADTYNECYR